MCPKEFGLLIHNYTQFKQKIDTILISFFDKIQHYNTELYTYLLDTTCITNQQLALSNKLFIVKNVA